MQAPDGVVVLQDEPLSRHVAARVGGPCSAFVVVHRRDALAAAIDACKGAGLGLTLLGAGTRVLVRDGGIEGAVLRLGSDFGDLSIDGDTVTVGAAVPVPALVQATVRAGLSGLEGLARAPGSVGALLHLDDGDWTERVDHVTVLSRGKEREAELDRARKRTAVVTGARFRLERSDPDAVAAGVARALRKSRASLPGALYERPGRGTLRSVLGRAGLAGVRLRSIAIPAHTPELLVNLGGASAGDVALLVKSTTDRVKRETGTDLETRARWLGVHQRKP